MPLSYETLNFRGTNNEILNIITSLPYFRVKLSCVCVVLLPYVSSYSDPKVTHSDPTHLPLPPLTSPVTLLASSLLAQP